MAKKKDRVTEPVNNTSAEVVAEAEGTQPPAEPITPEPPLPNLLPSPPAAQRLLDFGLAIRAMKSGRRVRRLPWPGGTCVALCYPQALVPVQVAPGETKLLPLGQVLAATTLNLQPKIGHFGPVPCLITESDGETVLHVGWLPDASDLVAEDWAAV